MNIPVIIKNATMKLLGLYQGVAIFLILICILPSEGAVIRRYALPHDAEVGHKIASLNPFGQIIDIVDGIDAEFSKFVSVLENGDLVTSQDVSGLAGKLFSLTINSVHDNGNWQENIHVEVFRNNDGASVIEKSTEKTPFKEYSTEKAPVKDRPTEESSNNVKKDLVFPSQPYSGHISSNAPIGTTVTGLEKINVNSRAQIHYAVDHSKFKNFPFSLHLEDIGRIGVSLVSKTSLHNIDSFYTFPIVACFYNRRSICNSVPVSVTVDGNVKSKVERHIPTFTKPSYKTNISEVTEAGVTILDVKASGIDTTHVSYQIITPTDNFKINQSSGAVVLVKSSLNPGIYKFDIVATDEFGSKSKPVSVSVTVEGNLQFMQDGKNVVKYTMVTNLNDRLKRSLRTRRDVISHHRVKRGTLVAITFEVPENSLPNNPLFRVSKGATGTKRYNFQDPSPRQFNIDSTNGDISLKSNEKLDYDNKDKRVINFNVEISDIQDTSVQDVQPVEVKTTDVNDEKPVFTNVPMDMWATVEERAIIGTVIYGLQAVDPDKGSRIQYKLEAGTEGKFKVDKDNGKVMVSGDLNGRLGSVFIFGVTATDVNGGQSQATTKRLSVKVGQKEPQFYESSYIATVPENAAGYSIVEIKAHSFQNKVISYSMLEMVNGGKASNIFVINQKTGLVTSKLPLDYEQNAGFYRLLVTATENSGGSDAPLTSTATLTINLVDMNDNAPQFILSEYIAPYIPEDSPIGFTVVTIEAQDRDSGVNSDLEYWVSDPHFTVKTVNKQAKVLVKQKLDYDRLPGHTYTMNLYAKDKGQNPLTATTNLRVIITNVNDEAPTFIPNESIIRSKVNEDAGPRTVIEILGATDIDGSQVTYAFEVNGAEVFSSRPFKINPGTGVVELTENLQSSEPKYEIRVIAKDDGKCPGCPSGGSILTTKALLVIEVIDKNNNRPVFENCRTYNPKINEGLKAGSFILDVVAKDDDSGLNGDVTYEVTSGEGVSIDAETGKLRTSKVFEFSPTSKQMQITIRAADKGTPLLESYCTFKVRIGDVNNHVPAFETSKYSKKIRLDTAPGVSILRVLASDKDDGNNAAVEYFLISDDSNAFIVNKQDGSISLKGSIPPVDTVAKLVIEARDKGTEPPRDFASNLIAWKRTNVMITVSNSGSTPPVWNEDYSRKIYRVKETIKRGTSVLTAVASVPSGNDQIIYDLERIDGKLIREYAAQAPFRMVGTNSLDIVVNNDINYEAYKKYTLKLVASTANGLKSDPMMITINIIDENDGTPMFISNDINIGYQGSVPENNRTGSTVITVTALDLDTLPSYKSITYMIDNDLPDSKFFDIDKNTGLITTKKTFDRETKQDYNIKIFAIDGAPGITVFKPVRFSSELTTDHNVGRGTVHISITDRNDEIPVFAEEKYVATVPENTPNQATVITVTAKDKDISSKLQYFIVEGNIGNVFGVRRSIGEIFVALPLDYDLGPKSYLLKYRAFDELHETMTTIMINVTDVNDNPPKFGKYIYEVRNKVTENEDPGINGKYLITVKATDPDKSSPTITYTLVGQYADKGIFSINSNGDIYQRKPLDREPPNGAHIYDFNVRAFDSLLSGYAEVKVYVGDVNDNAPKFDPEKLQGHVDEGSLKNVKALVVKAVDLDAGNNALVSYEIIQSPREPGTQNALFTIGRADGIILTNVNNIVRDSDGKYTLIVQASDNGSPKQLSSTATVTILVDDVNDKPPKFLKQTYYASLPEQSLLGYTVISVKAEDEDTVDRGQLLYSLLTEEDKKYFGMKTISATDTGVITVYQPVDYEDQAQPRQFSLKISVTDSNGLHSDECTVIVNITDINDNPPLFTPQEILKTVSEAIKVDTPLASFTASDADEGMNGQFDFFIDPVYGLRVQKFNPNGNVARIYVATPLDREKWKPTGDNAELNITVMAKDKGKPVLTGYATLKLTITDINDNFPQFAENYRPVVYEGEPIDTQVVRIRGVDPDASNNGPPFQFKCTARPVCSTKFKVKQITGDNNKNMADVTTKEIFDREEKKYHLLPIVMTDRHGVSGTNMLTVTIGDINDNDHKPGHKNIQVYNYEGWDFGKFKNTPLGNVYAQDPDDWDRVDKVFEAQTDLKYFRVTKQGVIYLKERVPSGTHTFKVTVTDSTRAEGKKTVVSTVSINIENIPAEPVYNAGSFRLSGITAEQFVDKPFIGPDPSKYGKSPYDKVRDMLAAKIPTKAEFVKIYTVLNVPGLKDTIDVRWTAHGSPYYQATKLDSVFADNRAEFATLLGSGVKIDQVPVDLCREETCEGGCANRLVVTDAPLLVNTNSTSLVGINSYIVKECVCITHNLDEKGPSKCKPDTCRNGGTCTEEGEVVRCKCPSGFDGSRCQQTKRSFNGDGWVWYPPMKQCESGHISLEFITQESTGLLLYSGPRSVPSTGAPTDFIAVEMIDGYPKVTIDHGSGASSAILDGKDSKNELILNKINDGQWHRLDIYRKGNEVQMMVDYCKVAKLPATDSSPMDTKACEAKFKTPGPNKLINVDQPLQLGGRKSTKFPQGITTQAFNGCIKNLMVNGELYDLFVDSSTESAGTGTNGCPAEDRSCGVNEQSGPYCGKQGSCVGSFAGQVASKAYLCICKPGWAGEKCTIETKIRDFKADSFVRWSFKKAFDSQIQDPYHSLIEVMFRTREKNGVIVYASSTAGDKYMIVRVTDSKLELVYSFGLTNNKLGLPNVNVADGVWHNVKVERFGKMVFLKLDGGEGRYYNYFLGGNSNKYQIIVQNVFAGQRDVQTIAADDFKNSCMNDVSYNNVWMPLSKSVTSKQVEIVSEQNVIDGCEGDVCKKDSCDVTNNFECIELWRLFECRCMTGYKPANSTTGTNICININECNPSLDPCRNGGKCSDSIGGYKCQCFDDWTGVHCEVKQEAVVAALSQGALIALILCIFILLLIVLAFVVYSRRRRNPKDSILEIYPGDDIRENIVHYDEEGAGEEDQDGYDISRLRKPIEPIQVSDVPLMKSQPLRSAPPALDRPDNVGDFISDRMKNADDDPNAPPHDTLHEFDEEGGGSTAGSISSLNSSSDGDQDYDYLNDWGPKFAKLADMYGGGE